MQYSESEILQYLQEEDVKFIRLAFCDVFGRRKNVSVMPHELPRAFRYGVTFDGSAIAGFTETAHSDLFLHPEPETLVSLPWRPEQGRVVRMLSSVTLPDGLPFEGDTRYLLKKAVEAAAERGYAFSFGAEQEFYLFLQEENGASARTPCDTAGYMDIAPEDRGENVRREVCLTLERMGVRPESSHHEEGPGQNEIDLRYADPVTAADQAIMFQTVVKTVAHRNGYRADFSPKPIGNAPGSGFHVNISIRKNGEEFPLESALAGILEKICELTVFLNPTPESYLRLGKNKAPGYVTWSRENRAQLVRIPAASGEYRRLELRSPDPAMNPYLAFALLIRAALYGIENALPLPAPADFDPFTAAAETLSAFKRLPQTLGEAQQLALNSAFVRENVPERIVKAYCSR